MMDRALQIVCPHQRPAVLDLAGGHPLERHVTGLGRGGVEHVFVHPRGGLRHPQVAHHRKARVQPRLGLQRLVEIDRILVDMGRGIRHVEQWQQARRMPGGAAGQLVPFQQHHIRPARARQVIGNRRANGAAPDNKRFDLALHGLALPFRTVGTLSQTRGLRASQPTYGAPKPTRPPRAVAAAVRQG
jgi:hypothetical protein